MDRSHTLTGHVADVARLDSIQMNPHCQHHRFVGRDGVGAVVCDRTRLDIDHFDRLDPGRWPGSVVVGSGGRGSAWFVEAEFGRGVLRQYRRGGLVARLITDRYLYLGERRVRSLREFALLCRMSELGLPVPRPLAAGYLRRGIAYRAAILVERIESARSLADQLRVSPDVPDWPAIGAALAQFHRCRVFHADLNAHNILMDGAGQVHVIDFDRGRIMARPGRWCLATLARLRRSLARVRPDLDAGVLDERFARLSAGYQAVLTGGHR